MSTKTDTYYTLRKKKNPSLFFNDFERVDGKLTPTTCGVEEAWYSHNPDPLIFKLDEYSEAFNGEWELAKIEQTTTITFKVSDAKKEVAKHKAEWAAICERNAAEEKARRAKEREAKKAKKA